MLLPGVLGVLAFLRLFADQAAGHFAHVATGLAQTAPRAARRLPDALWVSLVSYLVGAAVCGLVV